MAGDDEAELVVAETFDRLFVTEYPRMVALAAAVSGSRRHAEDIAQEAMTRLGQNWSKVQGYAKPGAWVRRVTINLALSQRRKLMSETKALLRLGPLGPALPPATSEDDHIWSAVAELPRRQRAVVALHFLEDHSIDEIADILGMSPSTARVHLHRARQTLRERLQEELG